MRIAVVLHTIGTFLSYFSVTFAAPAIVAAIYHDWYDLGAFAAAGVITALAGLVIAMGWPVNSLWVLGIFLAIDMVFQGWTFIAFGLALKK